MYNEAIRIEMSFEILEELFTRCSLSSSIHFEHHFGTFFNLFRKKETEKKKKKTEKRNHSILGHIENISTLPHTYLSLLLIRVYVKY